MMNLKCLGEHKAQEASAGNVGVKFVYHCGLFKT